MYREKRLTIKPHYFGVAKIGTVSVDDKNPKRYFAQILNFIPFNKPVLIKDKVGNYYEHIPESIKKYWYDGDRTINKSIFSNIVSLTKLKIEELTAVLHQGFAGFLMCYLQYS
ncbi:hypothetical protein [Metabacillus rhizolycopersici]|uniref:Uncharacterized protein n=1 Tax=Metabacillus rhizolycopersici TaxID=2875709 RepID=A0ABS7UVV8_9BACI|nr:hypothetical protein [Metabacillus rhizolycopersici]MBZ5752451.1 hypothetical protein [Metabacillus rhizolycopersici]